jgi:hypothetical protein
MRGSVAVQTPGGTETVPASIIGGLAVHRSVGWESGHALTPVRCGRRLARGSYRQMTALRRRLLALSVDWANVRNVSDLGDLEPLRQAWRETGLTPGF